MKKTLLAGAATVLVLGLGMANANAGVMTHLSNPTDVAIIDDNYDGTLASMQSSVITVAGGLGAVELVEVSIGMDHTWVGDLTIKLQSPTGTVVTLLNRPGSPAPDNGTGPNGDSSNLSALFPIMYRDSSLNDAEAMGNTIVDSAIIGDPGNGSPADYFPSADTATPGTFATFITEASGGSWTLYIGDSATGDVGTLDKWELWITTADSTKVPEPGTLGVLGLGLAGLAAMRRRRKA